MPLLEAVILRLANTSSIECISIDERLRPEEVLIRVIAVGLCGSDYKLVSTADSYLPTVPGHEVLGVVDKVGPGVQSVAVGDTVIPTVTPACGECWHCRADYANLCASGGSVVAGPLPTGGFHLTDGDGQNIGQYCFLGGFAPRLVTTARQLIAVPMQYAEIPEACLLACVAATGAGAVLHRQEITAAETIAIVGCGGVGASTLLAAKAITNATVMVVEPSPTRRAQARALGADVVVESAADARALALSDVVLEATSIGSRVNDALSMTRRGGTCIALGMPSFGGRLDLDYWQITSEQKTLAGTVTSTRSPKTTMGLLIDLHKAGKFPFERLVDTRLRLSDVPAALADFPNRHYSKAIAII